MAAQAAGAKVSRIDLCDKNIYPCKGVEDDFAEILAAFQQNENIIISVPVHFNLPSSPAVALLSRFFAVFAPAYQGSGKKKKAGILLVFGGSEPAKAVGQWAAK